MSLESLGLSLADRIESEHSGRPGWYDDPSQFARECIEWGPGGLIGYQADILSAVGRDRRVAVRAPHGASKTATAALAILWFALSRDAAGVGWKIITTAGSWHQLERYLWPEIRLWASKVRWDAVGRKPLDYQREMLALNLKLRHGQASAGASDNPQLLEGAHAESILLVLDEAKAIAVGTWDAVEGALSTGDVFALAISTPGDPTGRFYEICSHSAGLSDWHPIHVTLEQAIGAGRISRDWAEQRKAQWGEGSAVYQNRVLGEFASSDEDSVIPLSWIERAVARWHVWDDMGRLEPGGQRIIGVDVARFGDDKTVLATRQGDVVMGLERFALADTMTTAGRVMGKLNHPSTMAVVDSIGVGAGVLDRLREQKAPVAGFNASERSVRRDKTGSFGFVNKRAEAWWRLREMLDPSGDAELCLPDDDELTGELTSPRWTVTSAGKIQIESKDDIRKRLHRSTDAADAVIQSLVIPSEAGSQSAAVPWSEAVDPTGLNGAVPWAAAKSPVAARDRW